MRWTYGIQLDTQFKGSVAHFAAMTVEQVCEATGIKAKTARELANATKFGEPIEWLAMSKQKKLFLHGT